MPEALLMPAPVSATHGARSHKTDFSDSTVSLIKRIRLSSNADPHLGSAGRQDAYFDHGRYGPDRRRAV